MTDANRVLFGKKKKHDLSDKVLIPKRNVSIFQIGKPDPGYNVF